MTPQSSNISHRGTHFIELCTGEKKSVEGAGRLQIICSLSLREQQTLKLTSCCMLHLARKLQFEIWNYIIYELPRFHV